MTGSPALTDALAVFDCRLLEIKVVATHMILFGEVVGLSFGPEKPALLYMDRGYRTL